MNKQQLPKLLRKHVRLRPIAMRFDQITGDQLETIDDTWTVQTVDEKGLTLHNNRVHHGLHLNYDHIIEFVSSTDQDCQGFLKLKVQARLQGNDARVEPL